MKGSPFLLIYAYFLVTLERLNYDTNCFSDIQNLKSDKINLVCTNIITPKLLSLCGKLCMRRSSKQVLFSFDTSKSISIRSKFWQITTQKTCRLLASTIAGIQNFVQKIFGILVYKISYKAATDYFWCARPPHWRPHHLCYLIHFWFKVCVDSTKA